MEVLIVRSGKVSEGIKDKKEQAMLKIGRKSFPDGRTVKVKVLGLESTWYS